ncbi:type 1 glutamine amidotransferase [Gordonia sp. PKS22-38]|uniref:Type 1 glutamine amidotransferase n=1 Tax=Gordonia prachuapensis TaxID=3115651 RepID=A0ABU7MYR8_9ACTN|nr:type 1 glutamine amidotransferase [Gordonia sp. PKS22-38]
MGLRALTLVHNVLPEYRRAIVGSLLPAMERRGMEVEIVAADEAESFPSPDDVDLVVVTGSADSVHDESLAWIDKERQYLREVMAADVPIYGICFGGQILASALGGTVRPSERPEHGFIPVETTRPDLVAEGPWMEYHYDVLDVPEHVEVIARNDAGVQAFVSGPHLGVQFHPEISSECFVAWKAGFSGPKSDMSGHDVDLVAMAASIAEREKSAAADCDDLFERFLAHAGLASPTPVE